jgi:hypothetical protein
MKLPFWATREFRIFLFVLVAAGAGLLVLVFEILPAMSKKLPKSGAVPPLEGFLPHDGASKLPVNEGLKAALESVKDSTPIAEQEKGYTSLVDQVNGLSPELLASEAKPIAYSFFFRAPQTIRGRVVSVTAMFLDWKPIALEEKIGAVEFVNRIYLADPSGSEGYLADLLEPPPHGLEQKTLVTVDGIFLKTATYEGKKGPVEAPLIVGKRLQLVHREYQPSPLDMKAILAMVAVLSIALLLLTIWAYLHARRKPPAPRPRPSFQAGPNPFSRPWPLPPEKVVKPAFAPRKNPLPRRAPRPNVSEDIFSVSNRQRRALLVGIGGCGVVLVGMLGWLVYQRFAPGGPIEIDFTAASSGLLDKAAAARKDIREVEEKVAAGQKTLEEQDYALILSRLPDLEKAADQLRTLIQAARGRDIGSHNPEVARVESRLFEVQLWLLDANGVLDFKKEPTALPGFTIPFSQALDKWHAVEKDAAAIDAEATKASREKTLALQATLVSVRDSLAKLAELVKQRMDRPDLAVLKVPDLDSLLAESKRIDEEIDRIGKLVAPPTGN